MSVKRLVRVNQLIKQEVAEALYRVMNDKGFDLSAVTVTLVLTGSDLRTARVMVSIRDHEAERTRMLRQLEHRRGEIQEIVHRRIVLKYTPRLSFELDTSIETGDRVLQIISEMERKPPAGAEAGTEKGNDGRPA